MTAVKNKVGYPWKKASFELYYSRGIDLCGDTVDYGEKMGVIKKAGNTYSYGEVTLGVGREKAKTALNENKELYEKIRTEIKQKITARDGGEETSPAKKVKSK